MWSIPLLSVRNGESEFIVPREYARAARWRRGLADAAGLPSPRTIRLEGYSEGLLWLKKLFRCAGQHARMAPCPFPCRKNGNGARLRACFFQRAVAAPECLYRQKDKHRCLHLVHASTGTQDEDSQSDLSTSDARPIRRALPRKRSHARTASTTECAARRSGQPTCFSWGRVSVWHQSSCEDGAQILRGILVPSACTGRALPAQAERQ